MIRVALENYRQYLIEDRIDRRTTCSQNLVTLYTVVNIVYYAALMERKISL